MNSSKIEFIRSTNQQADLIKRLKKVIIQIELHIVEVMKTKKNYKEEDHFTLYYSVYIPRINGTKHTLFYKRYRPAKIQPKSVY